MHLRSYIRLAALLPLVLMFALAASSTIAGPIAANHKQLGKRTLPEYQQGLKEVFEAFKGLRDINNETKDVANIKVQVGAFRANWGTEVDNVLKEQIAKYEMASKSFEKALGQFDRYGKKGYMQNLIQKWEKLSFIIEKEGIRTANLKRIAQESNHNDLEDEQPFLLNALAKHEEHMEQLFQRLKTDHGLYVGRITKWNEGHPDDRVRVPTHAGMIDNLTPRRFMSGPGSSSSGPH